MEMVKQDNRRILTAKVRRSNLTVLLHIYLIILVFYTYREMWISYIVVVDERSLRQITHPHAKGEKIAKKYV